MNEKNDQQKALPPPRQARDYAKDRPKGFYRTFDSEAELRAQCGAYIKEWEAKKRPLTVAGLCVYLRISRETLSLWMSGEYDEPGNMYSDTLREAKTYIEMEKVEKGLTGEYNPHIAKFDLANNHGYKDRIESSGDPKAPIRHKHGFDTPLDAEAAWREAQQEGTEE